MLCFFRAALISGLISGIAVRIFASAGTASFSNVSLPATKVAAQGAFVNVSVQVGGSTAIQQVFAQVRYPNGDETDTKLSGPSSAAASGTWSGSVQIARNFSRFDQVLQVVFSAQDASGAWSRSDPSILTLAGQGPAAPMLAFTGVPAIGDSSKVSAISSNIDPGSAVFAMNIFVPGLGWYSKPSCSPAGTVETVPVNADGTISANYVYPGTVDPLATIIVGYLFPSGTAVPCVLAQDAIPSSFSSLAIAHATVSRVPPTPLSFAGSSWAVTSPGVPVGSPAHYFIANNAFTDNQGLHLKLSQCQMESANTWCGAEAHSVQPTGYGQYVFTINGPLSSLGPNTVVGLFVYGSASGYAHHELDFEFWRQSSDSLAAQFTVQPYTQNAPHRFGIPAGLTTATVSIKWTPATVNFSMWQGSATAPTSSTLIEQWTYNRTTSSSDVPPNGDQTVYMNIWTQNSSSTNSADAAEVVVSNFSFTPAQPSILPGGFTSAASYEPLAVAPGEIVALFGNQLGPSALAIAKPDASGNFPTSLAGTQILFDGKPAPLIYASDRQTTAVAPFELAGKITTTVQASYNGVLSDPLVLSVAPYKPALFTLNQAGSGMAAIVNQDGTINGPANPAPRNSYVSIYGTGGGPTNPATVAGQVAPSILTTLGQPAAVSFGGIAGSVNYAGGAPLEIGGLFQVNALVPATAPTGAAIPLALAIGNWSAQINATIAIR